MSKVNCEMQHKLYPVGKVNWNNEIINSTFVKGNRTKKWLLLNSKATKTTKWNK